MEPDWLDRVYQKEHTEWWFWSQWAYSPAVMTVISSVKWDCMACDQACLVAGDEDLLPWFSETFEKCCNCKWIEYVDPYSNNWYR